jgi:hypothetical protein
MGGSVAAGSGSAPVASGVLPRVASLKSPDAPRNQLQAGANRNGTMCVRVGWVKSLKAARALARSGMSGSGPDLSIDEIERSLPPLYWVIVPPQPYDVALGQFRELQSQGVESYLVTEGENKNAISLGLFESRSAAISVLEEKKRQNLNVVLANFPRNQISYALSFETEPDLVKEMVQAVEADYGGEFDFVEVNPCESVATPEENP